MQNIIIQMWKEFNSKRPKNVQEMPWPRDAATGKLIFRTGATFRFHLSFSIHCLDNVILWAT